MSDSTLRFYYPWPLFGIKLSRQWPNMRENTDNLAPLVRAAYVDLQPPSSHNAGENDLSGWAIGERDFRNRFRTWYDKVNDMFKIQFNSGTENVPIWSDALNIRQSDLRVIIPGPGGIESSVGGFYTGTPTANNAALTRSFPLSREWVFNHGMNTSPLIWDTFRSNGVSIVPAKVDVSDPNIAYFYFLNPVAGDAIVTSEVSGTMGVSFTDGTNEWPFETRLGFNNAQFYLTPGASGNFPVVNLRQDPGTGGSSGVTDHGDLTGLSDDDHAQYLLASDATSRAAFAANWADLTDGGSTSLHTHPVAGGSNFYAKMTGGAEFGDTILFSDADFNKTGQILTVDETGLDHNLLANLGVGDPHPQYLKAADATNRITFYANWQDLTDGGQTSLHTHAPQAATLPNIVTAEAFYTRSGMDISNSGASNDIKSSTDMLVRSEATLFIESLGNFGISTIPQSAGGVPGNIVINTGSSTGATNAPAISIAAGAAEDSGVGGDLTLAGGDSLNGDGGDVTIDAGDAGGVGDGGNITILAGTTVSGAGGNVTITAAPNGGVATLNGSDVVIDATANNLSLSASGAGVVEIDGTLGVNIDGAAAGVLFNSNILHNVGDPAVAQDAATKNYVDLRFQHFYDNMGGSSGVTDHGALTGLGDDDHPQYLLRTETPPGFYGVYFRESDGSPNFRNDTLIFDSAYFYMHPNSVGKPTVSLRSTSSGSALTVRDIDGVPTVSNVTTIQFTNGSVADQGGGVAEVTITAGGITSVTDGVSTYSSPSVLGFSNLDFYISRGTGGRPVVNQRQSLEPLSGYIDFVTVSNVFLETFAEHPSVVEDINVVCRSGSAIVGFYIIASANPGFRDGIKVTGADPITISVAPQKIMPTGANTLAVGDGLKMAIYQNGSAKGIRVKARLRRL